jgi:hypothetical protein
MAMEPVISQALDNNIEVAILTSEIVAGHVLEQDTDGTKKSILAKELPIDKVVDISEEVNKEDLLDGMNKVSFNDLAPDEVDHLINMDNDMMTEDQDSCSMTSDIMN